MSSNVNFEVVPPAAYALIEALRGVGYSVHTAIADLVDNSISAGAKTVWLSFVYAGPKSYISLVDDGSGMATADIVHAMTLGARNPLELRDQNDLGRFGLGLKTASFSQCRSLTVASRRDGAVSARQWDLDHVAATNDWQLLHRSEADFTAIMAPVDRLPSGTLVLWEKLDRLVELNSARASERSHDQFLAMIDRVQEHLAMVFHRYLEGSNPDLKIFINGTGLTSRVKPWDPFLLDSVSTISTPLERIRTAEGYVELRGFVLPHKDFLTEKEFNIAGGRDGWTAQQGFYVYRNRRMLVAGGWLGLGEDRSWTREEPFKLARLRLDIPNTADEAWKIDIKKSTARPPAQIRPRLAGLATQVRNQARQVFANRGSYGRVPMVTNFQHVWQSVTSGSAAAYKINRNHPAVLQAVAVTSSAPAALEALLRIVEETVPVQRIWLDAVETGEVRTTNFSGSPSADVMSVLEGLFVHLTKKVGLSQELARRQLLSTEPFQNFPDAVAALDAALLTPGTTLYEA